MRLVPGQLALFFSVTFGAAGVFKPSFRIGVICHAVAFASGVAVRGTGMRGMKVRRGGGRLGGGVRGRAEKAVENWEL
jgi:hypothetical protein